MGLTERLFEWSLTVDVSEGLRRGDLINTSPPTTVLMKEGLVEFSEKTKTGGKSEGRPWGASHYAFSGEKWFRKGYELSKNESGDFSRCFRIGKPLILESEFGFPNQAMRYGPVLIK